jgi:NAD(P)-dependent dehydrogenase (short-subunit alcohol dehydrogenase family)
MSRPVETVVGTGACSGIGLAITQYLSFQKDTTWHSLLADLNEDAFSATCPHPRSFDEERLSYMYCGPTKL